MTTLLFGSLTRLELPSEERGREIDGIELRLDAMVSVDLLAVEAFMRQSPVPTLLALRRKDQGGKSFITEEKRLALLAQLCSLKPDYVDLEYDVPSAFRRMLLRRYPQVQFLSSYHDFTQTPTDLEALWQKVYTPDAHITKIAVTAHSSIDSLRMFSFMRTRKTKAIGICMGEEGKLTRILAPLCGSAITYACLEEGEEAAPGQITAKELQETYRFRKLNRESALFALIGNPVAQSKGAIAHNAVFEKKECNAVYVKIPLQEEELPLFFQWAETAPLHGISVTMPYKEKVIPFLESLSPDVQAMGACNTVQIKSKSGFNTDGLGALDAIEEKGPIRGMHLVLVGAGGVAKAIAYEAQQRGARVTVLNRSPEKALAWAHGGGFDLFPKIVQEGYHILINCTPVGDVILEEWILPGCIAMDTVYVPDMTVFLKRAEAKGCQIIRGWEMFVHQAAAQRRLWNLE